MGDDILMKRCCITCMKIPFVEMVIRSPKDTLSFIAGIHILVRRHNFIEIDSRAPSQYPKRRLFVRSRKVSKPRDWYFKLSYRFEIWQGHRQHCCRSACQISERSDNSKYKSRGFETLRDLTEIRLFGYWDGPQGVLQNPTIAWYLHMSVHEYRCTDCQYSIRYFSFVGEWIIVVTD